MHAPSFRYELNLNTVILAITLVVTGAGWGIGYNALVSGRDANAAAISRLESRISTLETTGRTLDNHELRISSVETQARDSSTAMRVVEGAINSISSDIRLMRDGIDRLERAANGPRRMQN